MPRLMAVQYHRHSARTLSIRPTTKEHTSLSIHVVQKITIIRLSLIIEIKQPNLGDLCKKVKAEHLYSACS